MHATCGTVLDEDGRCSNCGLTPGPDEILTEPREGRGLSRSDPVAIALRGPHRLLEPPEPRQPLTFEITFVSPASLSLLGCAPDELLGSAESLALLAPRLPVNPALLAADLAAHALDPR